MNSLILAGPQALSQFRVENLIKGFNEYTNSTAVIKEIRSCFIHYVDVKDNIELTQEDKNLLQVLLTYDTALTVNNDPLSNILATAINDDLSTTQLNEKDLYLIRIVPRQGTISPWSSKPTNISNVCGLNNKMNRIERGIALLIKTTPNFPILDNLNEISLNVIFDRM